jgi:hypothetical protein
MGYRETENHGMRRGGDHLPLLSIELDGFVAVYISVVGSTGQQDTRFHPVAPLNRGCKYQEYYA